VRCGANEEGFPSANETVHRASSGVEVQAFTSDALNCPTKGKMGTYTYGDAAPSA